MAITLIYKDTTYGIDKIIKSIQTNLQNKLSWLGAVNIYGKLQRTERESGFLYEYWTSNRDYTEVFINDKLAGVMGFVVRNPRRINGYYIEADVDVISTIDLTKIYNNTRRDDERALNELKDILQGSVYVQQLNEIRENISNVFSDINTDLIKYRDMQPYYVFAINLTIKYNEDDCNDR